jgi:hypothetical protein
MMLYEIVEIRNKAPVVAFMRISDVVVYLKDHPERMKLRLYAPKEQVSVIRAWLTSVGTFCQVVPR